MLNIIYNGIKPNDYKFEYSVIDNNKVDYIDFDLSNDYHAGTPFVKIESKDKTYVDKIDASDYKSNGHIVFPLLAKTTAHKVIRVQISFETNETKWQSEVVEITLKNSVRADEEIENNYPTALIQLQEQIEELKAKANHSDKKFVHLKSNFEKPNGAGFKMTFDEDVRVVFTTSGTKQSKGQKGSWTNTKKGNKITDIVFQKGTYEFYDLINAYLGLEETINEYDYFYDQSHKHYDIPSNRCCVITDVYASVEMQTIMPKYIQKKFIKWFGKYSGAEKHCFTFFRMQFKFVKDFELRPTQSPDLKDRGFTGTIADAYIDCIGVIQGDDETDEFNIYFYPRPRRF